MRRKAKHKWCMRYLGMSIKTMLKGFFHKLLEIHDYNFKDTFGTYIKYYITTNFLGLCILSWVHDQI